MFKGLAMGVAIAALCFVCFEFFVRRAEPVERRTVEQMKAEVDPDDVALARSNPEAALADLDIKNFPAFVAFLDLDMGVTESALDTYENIFFQVAGYYANDTPVEIVEAIFRIYETKEYFYELTYRESLEYLQDTVPVSFDPDNPSGQSTKRVRVAADEIHDYLVAAYMKPQIEALEQQQAEKIRLQQRIQKNIGDIRARGAWEARARARNEQYNSRYINWHYRNYNDRYRRRY